MRTKDKRNREGRVRSRDTRKDDRNREGRERLEDLRRRQTFANTDNADGARQDAQSNQYNVVLASLEERRQRHQALKSRVLYGHVLSLVLTLEPLLKIDDDLLYHFPMVFFYSGFDCSRKWSRYLGDEERPACIRRRLSEALGVTEEEVAVGKSKLESHDWSRQGVAAALGEYLAEDTFTPAVIAQLFPCEDTNELEHEDSIRHEPEKVLEHLANAWTRRPCHPGPPGHSAMPARLRRTDPWRKAPVPCLKYCCRMCEAEFPNLPKLSQHENLVHGGARWVRSTCAGLLEVEPYVVSPAEKRATVERFAYAQQHSSKTQRNMGPTDVELPEKVQCISFWAELFTRFVAAHCVNVGDETGSLSHCVNVGHLDESLAQELYRVQPTHRRGIYRTLFKLEVQSRRSDKDARSSKSVEDQSECNQR